MEIAFIILAVLVVFFVVHKYKSNKKEELSSESDNDREIPIGGGGSTPDNE